MLTTKLGQTLTLGIALFWGFRSVEQIFYFGVKKFASNLLLLLFLFGTILYGWISYLAITH